MAFFFIFNKNSPSFSLWNKLYYLFLSYIWVIFLILLTTLFLKIVDHFLISYGFTSIMDSFAKSNTKIREYSFLKVAIIVPILEEILFRLYLKPTDINIKISLISFPLILSYMVTKNYFSIYTITTLIACIFFLFSITSLYYAKHVQNFIKKNNQCFIIISIISFGLMHLINIIKLDHFQENIFYIYPLFIIPQIIIGYFITNIRLKFSFKWGLALHVLLNSISMII